MSRRRSKIIQLSSQVRNFAAGLLIGSAFVTPVIAAPEFPIDDLNRPILLGSLLLLVLGLALRLKSSRSNHPAAPAANVHNFSEAEGIGRYRLQLGRDGHAD